MTIVHKVFNSVINIPSNSHYNYPTPVSITNVHRFIKKLKIDRRYLQAGLTFSTGIVLSIVAAVAVYDWEEKLIQGELQNKRDIIASAIEKNINDNLAVMQAMGTSYSASQEVNEQELQEFISPSLYRHISIYSIAWLPRISSEQKSINEETEIVKLAQNRQNQQYFPAKYVIPAIGNETILGFDFASNLNYKISLEQAAARKEIFVTARSNIFTDNDNESKLLVFLPVYHKNTTHNYPIKNPIKNISPLQQVNLKGFVMGILSIEAIVKLALKEVKIDSFNVYLEDITASEDQRFLALYEGNNKRIIINANITNSINIDQNFNCADFTGCSRIINIQNRRWLVRLLLNSNYVNYQQHWRSLVILIIGLIIASIVTIYLLILLRYTQQIEQVAQERRVKSQELEKALQELKETQSQLVQTEKMSSLGLLVAGVAHEINNPVNFIYGNIHHTNQYIQDLFSLVKLYHKHYSIPHPEILEYREKIDLNFLIEDMQKILSSMKIGTERILNIVLALRNFSRLDESDMKAVNIHEGIDSTLLILQTRLKANHNRPEIQIVKNYGNLPLIECYPSQINQVFMNILANAIDALDSYFEELKSQGIRKNLAITITTEDTLEDYIMVRIADNGYGIIEEVKKRLFDPFFTTKPVGKGTGLGLAISYQIVVDKHKGMLWCESIPGKGTEFYIKIPIGVASKIMYYI